MASMLTGSEESSQMFFKRGGKVFRKKLVKSKSKKNDVQKSFSKIKGEKRDKVATKRTQIAKNMQNGDNLGPIHKKSWHSTGTQSPVAPLIKKSLSSSADDLNKVTSYLETLKFPKSQWEADARSLVDDAKKMLKLSKKLDEKPDKSETVIQSLIQPNEVVESNRGSEIISNLLHGIASEVDGDKTPLDEYMSSLPPQRRKSQRHIVTKRPVRKDIINKKRFYRVLNKDELKKIDDITIKDD